MHFAALRNGQYITLTNHHMRALYPAAIQAHMTCARQFLCHGPVARETQKPQQLVYSEIRRIRINCSGFFRLQSGILFLALFFRPIFSPYFFALFFRPIFSLSLSRLPARQMRRQPWQEPVPACALWSRFYRISCRAFYRAALRYDPAAFLTVLWPCPSSANR